MKFSILIANYNNGKYFKDCFNSIISQTYSDWEAIIVDDKSTDDSLALIRDMIKGDTRFKLFENDSNRGCGYTKNRCASLANGEICGFLDPDDALTKDALSLMVNEHKLNPEASLIHSTFYYCNESLEKTSRFTIAGHVDINKDFINKDGRVSHFATFKKKNYDQTPGIDPTLLRGVDQDLYLKLSEKGSFVFLDEALYLYRIHSLGISTSQSSKAFYWQLKVIMKAEERRKVNLESQVQLLMERVNRKSLNYEKGLASPGYLVKNSWVLFKRNPFRFIKRVFDK